MTYLFSKNILNNISRKLKNNIKWKKRERKEEKEKFE